MTKTKEKWQTIHQNENDDNGDTIYNLYNLLFLHLFDWNTMAFCIPVFGQHVFLGRTMLKGCQRQLHIGGEGGELIDVDIWSQQSPAPGVLGGLFHLGERSAQVGIQWNPMEWISAFRSSRSSSQINPVISSATRQN